MPENRIDPIQPDPRDISGLVILRLAMKSVFPELESVDTSALPVYFKKLRGFSDSNARLLDYPDTRYFIQGRIALLRSQSVTEFLEEKAALYRVIAESRDRALLDFWADVLSRKAGPEDPRAPDAVKALGLSLASEPQFKLIFKKAQA